MKKQLRLFTTLLFMFVVSAGWAETKTLTVTMTGFASGSDNAYVNNDTQGKDDDNTLSFIACGYNPYNGQLRGNKTKIEAGSNGNFQIYNLDAIPGNILSIKLSHTTTGDGKFQNNIYVATGTYIQDYVNDISGLAAGTLNVEENEFSWNFNPSDNISFFKICTSEKFTSGTVTGGQVTITYEEVVDPREPVTLRFSPDETDGTVGEEFYEPTLEVDPNERAITNEITYSSSDPGVATVDERSGEVTLVNRGTTTITALFRGDEYYKPANTSYILHVYKESVVEDGVFDFVDKTLNYGTLLSPSSDEGYITETIEWRAGNVTLETSGRYRWWEDGTLRFYHTNPESAMTFSVPYGYMITNITIDGGRQWSVDAGEYNSTDGTWEGLSRTVKFEMTSNKVEVRSVTVDYIPFVPSPQPVAYQYMTYCSNSKLDFTGMPLKAYIASGCVSGRVQLTRVYKVPAKKGIMIKSDNEDLPAEFNESDYITDENFSAYYNNSFVGVVESTTIDPTYNIGGTEFTTFVLAKPSGFDLGFYPITHSDYFGPNKAYLLVESEALDQAESANGMAFEFLDDTDAIQGVESKTEEDGAWYTIQGVRVAQPTQSGVYIHNGVKVVVK